MKILRTFLSSAGVAALLVLSACGGNGGTDTSGKTADPTVDPDPAEPVKEITFARGADVSWLTEMEKGGKTFKGSDGKTADLFAILKSKGMNSIRLRVWVNPDGGWCGKADVVAKAKRATAAGLAVMIDFHYSDFFADPARQTIPSAWGGLSLSDMSVKVSDHTKEVLTALKSAGVTPQWIQIGNETRTGMLWDVGRTYKNSDGDISNGWSNYAALSNAGYAAAKSVFPDASVIVHINNAWKSSDNVWFFQKFKAAGGKFDMIGVSHYPMTESSTWQQVNSLAVSGINTLASTYKCKVMVCEVGVKVAQLSEATSCMKAFMDSVKGISGCAGVFYWEPEVYGGWKPAVYTTLGWNAYDMGAFSSAGQPTTILDAFAE